MRARGVQKKPDLVEGITLASAVTQGVLLDAAAYLIKGVTGELDDVKGIEHAGCVLGAGQAMAFLYPWKGSRVAIRTPARKSSPRSANQFSCAVPDLPGTRSTQAGCGMILPACQVHDAGELTGPSSASVLVMPHMLINPQYPHACEAGGVIRCGLQARLDVGPHGILRSCQLSSQSCNGGSLQSAHTQGSQQGNHRTLCRAPEHLGCESRSSDGSPPNRRADHTDHNGQATQSSSR